MRVSRKPLNAASAQAEPGVSGRAGGRIEPRMDTNGHEFMQLGLSSPRTVLPGNFAGQFASREAAKSAKENAKFLCLLFGGHWASRGRKSAGEGLSVARAFQPEVCAAAVVRLGSFAGCLSHAKPRSREGKRRVLKREL